MTISEKLRTEYKLIYEAMAEVTLLLQKIETLETSAEQSRHLVEEFQKSVVTYRKVVEQLPQRIFFKDLTLVYVVCNNMYANDLNITPGEISGKSDHDFFPRELAEKIIAVEKEILHSGVKKEGEEKYVVSGQELTVFATKTPVRNDNGNVIGLQVALQDITEDKRQAENQALQIKNLEDLLCQEKAINDTLRNDLNSMTAQLDQLEAESKEVQGNLKNEMALRDAEIENLKTALQQETKERKDTGELLRKSFYEIHCLINSAQHLMATSSTESGDKRP
jgi:PAS domain S-box-containing protein